MYTVQLQYVDALLHAEAPEEHPEFVYPLEQLTPLVIAVHLAVHVAPDGAAVR